MKAIINTGTSPKINKIQVWNKKELEGQKNANKENKGSPMPAEWCRAVAPKLLAIAGSAPCSRRNLAVSVCPCLAAWISGVSPVNMDDKFQAINGT